MEILSQFLLRLAFGLAVGMGITSSRQVFSGFFRNHLYVTLGLATLAVLAIARLSTTAAWLAATAAVLSFVGAACWLYEATRVGKIMIWLVALFAICAALVGQGLGDRSLEMAAWQSAGVVLSGLVLGLVFASMLLGHWYLNAPGMELAPLRRLLSVSTVVVLIQALYSALGLIAETGTRTGLPNSWLLFILLRWSFGILGVLGLLWMTRRTLDIPNTQSATGILYVAVIGVFVGELAGALLSAESVYPL